MAAPVLSTAPPPPEARSQPGEVEGLRFEVGDDEDPGSEVSLAESDPPGRMQAVAGADSDADVATDDDVPLPAPRVDADVIPAPAHVDPFDLPEAGIDAALAEDPSASIGGADARRLSDGVRDDGASRSPLGEGDEVFDDDPASLEPTLAGEAVPDFVKRPAPPRLESGDASPQEEPGAEDRAGELTPVGPSPTRRRSVPAAAFRAAAKGADLTPVGPSPSSRRSVPPAAFRAAAKGADLTPVGPSPGPRRSVPPAAFRTGTDRGSAAPANGASKANGRRPGARADERPDRTSAPGPGGRPPAGGGAAKGAESSGGKRSAEGLRGSPAPAVKARSAPDGLARGLEGRAGFRSFEPLDPDLPPEAPPRASVARSSAPASSWWVGTLIAGVGITAGLVVASLRDRAVEPVAGTSEVLADGATSPDLPPPDALAPGQDEQPAARLSTRPAPSAPPTGLAPTAPVSYPPASAAPPSTGAAPTGPASRFDDPVAAPGYGFVVREVRLADRIGGRPGATLEAGAMVRRLAAHQGWVLILREPSGPAGFVEADLVDDRKPVVALARERAFEGCRGPAQRCVADARRQLERCLEDCGPDATARGSRCVNACRIAFETCEATCRR